MPLFIVDKQPDKSLFKCIPNRSMMQRIVNKYNLVVQQMRDPSTGALIPFRRFNRALYE